MSDPTKVSRRLVAVFAADVEGYSRLMGADEVGTLKGLTERRAILDRLIGEHGGRIANTAGDSVLAEFGSAVDAVQCAVEAQTALTEANSSHAPDRRICFRIGIHIGDVMVRAGDLFGDGVNIAARLQTLANPGAVCISGATYDQVRKVLPMTFVDLGAQQVKNIQEPIRAYQVGAASETREADLTRVAAAESPLALPDKPSIAVLPFQNMSGDPEQEHFADGMVEDIITALSRFKSLFVIARNSSFTYKDKVVDIRQVGREMGVRYVLEGSVRKSGNRARITAQLIDATSGAHVWADRYDRDLSDFFAVQDEITATVAGTIEPALSEAEQRRALRKPPHSLDAWEAYQRGVWHFNRYSSEDNKTALTFFRQAMNLDPSFAPGHYGYALALQWDIWHFSTRPFQEVQGKPREEAHLAVSLDDKDAMAHAVLAHMMMWGSEWAAAIAQARTAIALNPNSAFVISMLGCVLGFGGNQEEALDWLRRAMRASPQDPLTWLWTLWTGAMYFFLRRFDAAIETFEQIVRLRPTYVQVQETLAAALAYSGRIDEARKLLYRARAQARDPRYQNRPPWLRPQDYELRQAGIRLAETPE
jgi:adenylate cyclase